MSDDVNEQLLATTTASAEGVAASERWLSRAKRRPAAGNDRKRPRPSEETRRVDVDPLPPPPPLPAETTQRRSSEVLAHRVLEYVMRRERGGRHNASRLDEWPPFARAVLLAETSRMRRAAGLRLRHAVRGRTSETLSDEAAELVVRCRAQLRVANGARDLVGGLTDGKAPHTRRHLMALVRRGLRGERDAAPREEKAPAMKEQEEKPVVLFGGAAAAPLSSFLRRSSSSSSSASSSSSEET